MIRHVVSWRFDGETPAARIAQSAEAAGLLQSLPSLIPEIAALQTGANSAGPETNWDLVLIADYADAAALETYQTHPEHQAVAARIREMVAERATVDFEV